MGHALKIDTEDKVVQHVHVKVETVRIAARKVGRKIEDLTNKISQEIGAEADKAISED